MTLDAKAAARKSAFAARKAAHETAGPGRAAKLSEFLAGYRGVPLAGYMPIRTEISPLPAMAEAAAYGPVGVPVIEAAATPLRFARWEPDAPVVAGAFGAQIPATLEWIRPEIVIVPLVAFAKDGHRLGYGGGFYDRTLELLRQSGPVLAVGFAYAAQEAQALPIEPTDQPLDLIITETAILSPNT
ncbi:5-formyltetrahydrofolate cyclo-ligase [Pseudoprimorskyibacter insulae]|uniref:5-formyltetrahydrofolate cyclo-ligase n=1 Tax=Pseudoprimorskyibacter insulae TaxID=1695997 RepID=A0A2R8AR03_9RHOB|nr:5-formyltetrahydrofolate cyclo-ligase [Pseudoprimorskyibacter insulae]SPF78307.1 5-formyltetrahydrofolate cyclo-ligase [Pseudoprimorskyibacter insulae]